MRDSSGSVLASQDVGKDTDFSTGITDAGTYYVAVDAYNYSAYTTYHDSGEYSLTASIATGSTANIETEDNNSRDTADAVVSGSEIKGQLSSETDIDYYSLAATAAGTISINFDPTINSSTREYYTVSLRDSSGSVLASQDVGKDTDFSAGITDAGTYYVAVDAYNYSAYTTYHDSGEYSLTASIATGSTANIETEDNNSRDTADAVVSGSEIKGQLSSETDIDYYSLAATAAGTISINFDPTINSSTREYYTVSLRDSSGSVLASQDVGKDTDFSAGITDAGTYYVAVDAYNYSAYTTYHDSGEYSLTASIATGSTANIETEDNNSRDTADAVVSGSEIKGQLSSETDIDYYSLAATAAGTISINFDPHYQQQHKRILYSFFEG